MVKKNKIKSKILFQNLTGDMGGGWKKKGVYTEDLA